jgi:hypothetical protein
VRKECNAVCGLMSRDYALPWEDNSEQCIRHLFGLGDADQKRGHHGRQTLCAWNSACEHTWKTLSTSSPPFSNNSTSVTCTDHRCNCIIWCRCAYADMGWNSLPVGHLPSDTRSHNEHLWLKFYNNLYQWRPLVVASLFCLFFIFSY